MTTFAPVVPDLAHRRTHALAAAHAAAADHRRRNPHQNEESPPSHSPSRLNLRLQLKLQHEQHQQSPFSHQLNPPTSPYSPVSPLHHSASLRLPRRSSSTASTMPGANGNGPMPVPGGPHGRMNNGNAHLREMGFNGPRSPPNNKSMFTHTRCLRCHGH